MKSVLTFFISVALSIAINGLGLSVLWHWFIVETFNAPELTIPQAAGVALVASYLTLNMTTAKEVDPLRSLERVLVKAGVSLAFGYAIWVVLTW